MAELMTVAMRAETTMMVSNLQKHKPDFLNKLFYFFFIWLIYSYFFDFIIRVWTSVLTSSKSCVWKRTPVVRLRRA